MTPREVFHWTKSIEGKDRREWAQTAQICALLANTRASGTYAVIAPNMAKQIVALQVRVANAAVASVPA